MEWILIVWIGMGWPSPAMVAPTFSSQEACNYAFEEIKRANRKKDWLNGVCVPKGNPAPMNKR